MAMPRMPQNWTKSQLTKVAISWVNRSRAGDQVATAALQEAKRSALAPGATPQQKFIHQVAASYIKQNPQAKLSREAASLGAPPEMSAEATLIEADPVGMLRKRRGDHRPMLPRGALEGVFNPDKMKATILASQAYRDGMGACVVAMAAGPSLSPKAIGEIGASHYTSDAETQAFFHGAQFCSDEAWQEAASELPRDLRPALMVGQCLGRVCRLQAVRQPDSNISDFDPIIGWELGE